jgi:hypothetical protein
LDLNLSSDLSALRSTDSQRVVMSRAASDGPRRNTRRIQYENREFLLADLMRELIQGKSGWD